LRDGVRLPEDESVVLEYWHPLVRVQGRELGPEVRAVQKIDGAEIEVDVEVTGDREHLEGTRGRRGHVKLDHVDTLLSLGS
jgi:hypothetical protein